jgi:hypothetical protein
MPYRKYYKKKFRPRRYRKRKTYGPGRGYPLGMSRFGRIAQPELKSKILSRDSTIGAGSIEDIVIFPSIVQGIDQDQRIGNRIVSKFLNVKVFFTISRQPDISLPQEPGFIRYVMWSNKDPTSNASATISGLNLTSFINTKQVRIHKTGYLTMNNYGQAKVLKLNHKCRNRVIDFKEATDVSANTTQRYYLTVFSTQQVGYEYQSKFYFSDP